MPATRAAALVTDAYRRGLISLRDSTAQQVVRLLADVDLDVSRTQLERELAAWRRRSERLTAIAQERAGDQTMRYLSAFLVASGGDALSAAVTPATVPVQPLVATQAALFWRLGQGAGRQVAMVTAASVARRRVRGSIGETAAETLSDGMREDPQIGGWHVATSLQCCDRCADRAGTRQRADRRFKATHNECRCTPEPELLGRAEKVRRRPPTVVTT